MGLGQIARRVVFLTGTRADFGKLKPLMRAVEGCPFLEGAVFVTGMHMLSRYGLTIDEVIKAGFARIHAFMNQFRGEPSEHILANTITGLSRYVQEYEPDMIVVHGDRIETLAGAIVGALRNVLVAHIEGGEISGTIDETIRHAVSKLAHLHFVANQSAAERLRQLGERPQSIHVIGSPDIDIMLSHDLPEIETVRGHYGIRAPSYGIVLFHPVTTEPYEQDRAAAELLGALVETALDYVVIYPNNDPGSECILERYAALDGDPRFKLLPSMRFESFLTLLKHAQVIVGNSSAGIREAPVYGVPTVNIGSRQQNRYRYESILDVPDDRAAIREAIAKACRIQSVRPSRFFGDGHSAPRFLRALSDVLVWDTPRQKQFCDIDAVPDLALS
jgi:UDP-N-acetylglucosamine 2-epimerase (hydrolysing)